MSATPDAFIHAAGTWSLTPHGMKLMREQHPDVAAKFEPCFRSAAFEPAAEVLADGNCLRLFRPLPAGTQLYTRAAPASLPLAEGGEAVAIIEACATACDELADEMDHKSAKRMGAIECAIRLRANIPRLRAWAHQDAKQEAKPAMPHSLLRKADAPLVCYCPPGVCQAPAGFKGPCNRAIKEQP